MNKIKFKEGKGVFFMAIHSYLYLLDVTEVNEIVAYNGNTKKQYFARVTREVAEFFRKKLNDLAKDEDLLFEVEEANVEHSSLLNWTIDRPSNNQVIYQGKKKEIDDRSDQINRTIKAYKRSPDAEMTLLDSFLRHKDFTITNLLLTEAQHKGAFGLASKEDFQKMGYPVNDNQKAIHLLTEPISEIAIDKQSKQIPVTYRYSKPFYDISQTNCPFENFLTLYPETPENFDFKGTEEDYKALNSALHAYAKDQGISIRLVRFVGVPGGNYLIEVNEMVLNKELTLKERTKSLIQGLLDIKVHIGHPTLEKDSVKIKKWVEYPINMCTYVASQALGLDTESSIQHYLKTWAPKEIEDQLYIQLLEGVQAISVAFVNELVEYYNKSRLYIR